MNPRQRRGVIYLIFSAILGIGLFIAITSYVSSVNASVAPLVTVYQAQNPIAAYAVISSDDLTSVDVPEKFVAESALRNPDDIVGRRAAFNIAVGTYLGSDMLRPPSTLADAEREVALSVDATTGIAGRVAPGDRVDVIAVFETGEDIATSQAIARSVRVVSVGGIETRPAQTSQNEIREQTVVPVTLALSADQTFDVALADAVATTVRLIGLPDGIENQDRQGESVGTNIFDLQNRAGVGR